MNDFKRNDRFGSKPSFRRPSGGFGRPQGEMYPATCANCGKATEVPFRPDGQRPIYCRDCYGSKEGAPTRDYAKREYPKREFARPSFSAPAPAAKPQAPDPRINDIQRNLAQIHSKLDHILLEIAVAKAQAHADEPTATVAKKKTKSTKKK